ncbi:glycosyltransferase family 39 protein [Nocardia sp. NPDC052254]|uniref:glycosyltransferase family 39 protein n=1 Tax=Nocardia sp. NPDC052254 TaxID=3155681 RepID=UPI003415CB4B
MTTTLRRPTPAATPEPASAGRSPWERRALTVLLLSTAVAYLCNLDANRWANSFYAAAAQAGAVSWKALFFGSADAANSITVDKPAAGLWPMDLFVQAFGLNSWTLLIPQVLLGVAAVALLWATVRRPFGPVAGLLAGAVLAVTPVAALMFRYDHPDALLVLLLIAACWAMTRAVEDGRWRWLLLCGALVGFGVLTKQLQALLVVPGLAITYLIAGPPRLRTRIAQLFAAGGATIAAAGWWIAAAGLWPVDSRPYFGGSSNNSIWELTFWHDGLGRLTGAEGGSPGSGGDMAGFWGQSGITRLFEPAQGGQIAWLLPAALILLVAGIILCARAARTDSRRAALLMWGGWLLVTGLVFSGMRGIFHAYYTVALAPAIAALTGAGVTMLWSHRERLWVRPVAAATLAATTATAWMLLSRSTDFVPWLRWTVLLTGIAVAIGLLPRTSRRASLALATAACLIGVAGPVAYSADTLATAHSGPVPSAGPRLPASSGAEPAGAGESPQISAPSEDLTVLLNRDGLAYTWIAATVGSDRAATYQLATQLPVLAVGGFSGGDPSPTLDRFRNRVAAGEIHYFIGGADRAAGQDSAARITAWVEQHFTAQTVDGVPIYDLTTPR